MTVSALDRDGIFKAKVIDWSLVEKEGKPPNLVIEYEATALLDNGEWIDWTPYGATIRGYHYPFTKEGELNTKTIEQLMASLGWDGLSLENLQSGDYMGREVQIVVKTTNYEGRDRRQVAWLNPGDYDPSIRKMDEKEVKALGVSWNAKLRAMNAKAKGGNGPKPSPKPAPARPAAG